MNHAACALTSLNLELVQVGDAIGQRAQRLARRQTDPTVSCGTSAQLAQVFGTHTPGSPG